MSNDTERQPRRRVPWIALAALLVNVTRFLFGLWRKG
jgi:hypothetical protein